MIFCFVTIIIWWW